MKSLFAYSLIIARRDFLAVVATPTFLLFLLAPLFMIVLAALGGSGASQVAVTSANAARIAVIAAPADVEDIKSADKALRSLTGRFAGPPELEVIVTKVDAAKEAESLIISPKTDYYAVMHGALDKPQIAHREMARGSSAFLSSLANEVMRKRKTGTGFDAELSKPTMTIIQRRDSSVGGRQMTAYLSVFLVFFLTLLLAGQAVGMLAEEKSNKVIEILAAAVPLEAVFLGKLVGMFGVAVLFVSFWGGMAGLAVLALPDLARLATLAPAVGLPTFMVLCALYFTMAYMLLGAVFLGVGGQAGTMREVQMLSLPVTIFMVAMFGMSSAGANNPGSTLATFTQWFPFSSPYAMTARAATDPALLPHIMALIWQAIWVAITIWVAARLFRVGVLKSGSWKSAFGFGRSTAKGA
jgi:ABC-2 type transport system permease protein